MFIINLIYIKPITEIDDAVEEHRIYLDKYYKSGHFICSGKKEPRNGGIILCKANSKQEVNEIIKEDPFYIKKLVQYEVTEFYTTKYAPAFEVFTK